MSTHRFVVVARKNTGTVEFDEGAQRCVARYGDEQAEGTRAGDALWEVMRKGGLSAHSVNGFTVFEGDEDGTQICSLHPVLHGAHAVWMVLYRANKEASVFERLTTRHRIADAMNAAFDKLRGEIVKPYKG